MAYQKLVGTPSPGLFFILIDQSGSMSAPMAEGKSRAEWAALAVNRCIMEIVKRCEHMESIKDRCSLVVIGYGAPTACPQANGQAAYIMLGGKISEIANKKLRTDTTTKKTKISDGAGGLMDGETKFHLDIWIEPYAEGSTPMDQAFSKAEEVASKWVLEYPDNFPPVVVNITDGEPSDSTATDNAAKSLMRVATSDGNLLLFNGHITDGVNEIVFPTSEAQLTNPLGKLMFRMSSEIPPTLLQASREVGFESKQGCRGLIVNGRETEMIKLINFGSSVAT